MSNRFDNEIIRDSLSDQTQISNLGFNEVVMLGSGPFTEFDFNTFLKSNGFAIVKPSSEVSVLIIGERDWNEAEVMEILKLRSGNRLRIYSQEMFLLQCSLGMDPLKSSKKILESFAESHAGLQFLIKAGFQWMATTTVPSFDELNSKMFSDTEAEQSVVQ